MQGTLQVYSTLSCLEILMLTAQAALMSCCLLIDLDASAPHLSIDDVLHLGQQHKCVVLRPDLCQAEALPHGQGVVRGVIAQPCSTAVKPVRHCRDGYSMLPGPGLAPAEHWSGAPPAYVAPHRMAQAPHGMSICVCSSIVQRPATSPTALQAGTASMHGKTLQLTTAGNPACTHINASQDTARVGAGTLTAGQLGPQHRPHAGQLVQRLHHIIHAGV